jgi:membrane fusion protein (multidrug efflux system)
MVRTSREDSMADAQTAPEHAQPGSGPGSDAPPATAKKPNRTPLIILAVVVVVLAVVGIWYAFSTRNLVTTDDAQVDGNAVALQAKVSGYVSELDITDNQRVKAGQLLFRIDPRDYIAARDQASAAVAEAVAQEENAAASLETTRVSAPAKLIQAEAQTRSAAASRDLAVADLGRQTSVDRRSTTQQNIDQATQNLHSANATLANNQAQVAIARLVPQSIAQAKAQLDQAKAQVAQAKAQLATAELNLGYTEIRAPQDGWVTQRNIQLGSYVVAGQSAFSLVAPTFWVTANFKENQLGRMRIGQKVEIKIDAYHHMKLEGHVDSFQMGTGSRFSAFPAENATGNFIKIVQRVPVKIVIDRGLDPRFPLPLGLSVDPTVDLK